MALPAKSAPTNCRSLADALPATWFQTLTGETWWPGREVKPETKAEAQALIPAVEAAMHPAGEAIRPLLGRMSVVLPSRNTSDGELKAQAKLYLEFLSEFPFDVVKEATDEAIKSLDWWPTIHQLRELCEKRMGIRRRALWRLEDLIARPTWKPPETEEQRAQRLADFERVKAGWRPKLASGGRRG